jgi:7-cyano-7-deazaguanine synthase
MSIVTLTSGGLDSTLMAVLARDEKLEQYPLFIDYGQLAAAQEWRTCLSVYRKLRLPKPVRMDLGGFGHLIPSGITSRTLRINEDAFLPGRNLLFLVAGAAYCSAKKASAVMIGLLTDAQRIFPDQSTQFLESCEKLIELAIGSRIRVVAPLIGLSKKDVLQLIKKRRIQGTYSCHSGRAKPCGICVSCRELISAMKGTE